MGGDRLAAGAVLLGASLAVSGCLPGLTGQTMTPAERVARLTVDEARPALQQLDAPEPRARENACRALAADAERLRRLGDAEGAERNAQWVLDRYRRETDEGVKYTIITLCAPTMGRKSPATKAFLCERIALGDLAGPAALALADLAPEDAYGLLAPLAEHPSPTVRADGALALAILGDPRGAAAVRAVAADMHPPAWPKRIWGVSLEEARANLSARADGAFGRRE